MGDLIRYAQHYNYNINKKSEGKKVCILKKAASIKGIEYLIFNVPIKWFKIKLITNVYVSYV